MSPSEHRTVDLGVRGTLISGFTPVDQWDWPRLGRGDLVADGDAKDGVHWTLGGAVSPARRVTDSDGWLGKIRVGSGTRTVAGSDSLRQ